MQKSEETCDIDFIRGTGNNPVQKTAGCASELPGQVI
jgi:hypothetical protein